MSFVGDLYRHPKTKYIFGFGGPRNPDKKKRNPRHILLKICLPLSFILSFIKLVPPFVAWISQATPPSFSSLFLNYPSNDAFRSLFRAVLGVQVGYMLLTILQAWNFLVVWHRKDSTVRRSVVLAAGDLVLVAAAVANMLLVKSMRAAQPSNEEILEAFPDLDLDENGEEILGRGVTHTFPSNARAILALVCIDAAVHVAAITFWHWLLPPVWRFPVHYEPLVQKPRGGKYSAVGGSSEVELTEQLPTETSEGQKTLASQFQEQETQRPRPRSTIEPEDTTHGDVRAPLVSKRTWKRKQISGPGPEFAPEVRYWASGTSLFNWTMRPLCLWGLFSLVAESIIYALIRAYDVQCKWYCHMRFAWILVVASTLATTVILVRFRVPLDYKLCNTLRIDFILVLLEWPLSSAGAALHIHRHVEVISGGYVRAGGDPGLESASQAARVLGMLVSFFWSLLTVVGAVLMPLSLWKSYRWRKSVKKLE